MPAEPQPLGAAGGPARLDALTGLRFVAAAAVFVYHLATWLRVPGFKPGTLGPAAWADQEPCATIAALQAAQAAVDRRLIAQCDGLADADLDSIVRVHRGTRVQTERRDRLLLHLFLHQTHHRGQAHGMLSGTSVKPPQLDEFYSIAEAPLRAAEFAELGWTEADVWGGAAPPAKQ